MSKKKIYIHIGQPKTGSTAIQNSLHKLHQKGQLQKLNFTLINADVNGLLNLAQNIPSEAENLESLMSVIRNFLQQTNFKNIIISSENFFLLSGKNIQALAETLQGHRVNILCYLRRQDQSAESNWAQMVKIFATRPIISNIWAPTALSVLKNYSKCFGKENIELRIYKRNNLYKNDSVCDFLQWVGLENLIPHLEKVYSNPSLSPTNLRIRLSYMRQNMLSEKEKEKRLAGLQTKIPQYKNGLPWDVFHDLMACKKGINVNHDFLRVINPLLALETTPQKNTHAYMSLEQRKKFLEKYKEENATIAREFLSREDGILFDDDMPQETISIDSPTTDDLVASFLPIFVHLTKRIEKLEEENKKIIANYTIQKALSEEEQNILKFKKASTQCVTSDELLQELEKVGLLRIGIERIDPQKMVVACLVDALDSAVQHYTSITPPLEQMPQFVLLDVEKARAQELAQKYNITISTMEEYKANPKLALCAYSVPHDRLYGIKGGFLHTNASLLRSGFEVYYYDFSCIKDFRWPRKQNSNFVQKRMADICKIYNKLADEESKDAYLRAIKCIETADAGYLRLTQYNQYCNPFVQPQSGDFIIDGGLCGPQDIEHFAKIIGQSGHVYGFEPVSKFAKNIATSLASYNNVTIEQLGLWSEKSTFYIEDQGGASRLVKKPNANTEECHTIDIDTYVQQNSIKCSLIKLDIEGAEMEAIKGAKKTISTFKPKLQISLYHQVSHYVDIPLMIMQQHPEYTFYCGHHSTWYCETVLYAIANTTKDIMGSNIAMQNIQKKNIYLHIGMHKTGSTAIQDTLRTLKSKGILQKNGFDGLFGRDIYPILNIDLSESETNMPRLHALLSDFLNTTACENIIFSCEGFFKHENIKKTKKIVQSLQSVCSGHNVQILAYLRRRDTFIEASWGQRVKIFSSQQLPKTQMISQDAIKNVLDIYKDTFKKEHMTVRIYDRNLLYKSDSVDDFLQWIGLEHLTQYIKQKNKLKNTTLSATALRIALSYMHSKAMPRDEKEKKIKEYTEQLQYRETTNRDVHNLFILRNGVDSNIDFAHTVSELLKIHNKGRSESIQLLTPEQRQAIWDASAEEDAAIAREYLGREDGKLFDHTMPKDIISLSNPTTDDLVLAFLPILVDFKNRFDKLELKHKNVPKETEQAQRTTQNSHTNINTTVYKSSSYQTLKNILFQPFIKKKAFALVNAKQFAKAEVLAQRVIANNPYMAWAYYILGRVQWNQGEHDAAIENVQKAIKIEPTTAYFIKYYNACVKKAMRF